MTLRRDIRRAERRVQAAQRDMAAMTIWERKSSSNVKFWMHDVKCQDFRYRAEKTTQLVRP